MEIENTFTGPGIYPAMSNEEYHRLTAVGSSGLKEAIYTAATYFKNYLSDAALEASVQGDEKEAKATRMGSALHTLVLEPHTFTERYAFVPENAPKRPTSAQREAAKPSPKSVEQMAWWDSFALANHGKIILPTDEYEAVVRGATIINAHPVARGILTEGMAEVSYFAIDPDTGLLCKSRPDWTVDNGDGTVDMADLKSTSLPYALTVDRWKSHCKKNGYFMQASHHGDILQEATKAAGKPVRVANNLHIAYSFADELCRVFRIPEAHLDMGRSRAAEAKGRIAEGMETGLWAGFAADIAELPVSDFDGREIE